jgi:hypothetical protein
VELFTKYVNTALLILFVFGVLIYYFPEKENVFVGFATATSSIATIGLAALTYIYAVHTKELADLTRQQADLSKKQAEISDKSVAQADEQANRRLRPIIIPEITHRFFQKWVKWSGVITILNGGNGPAIQPVIQILNTNSAIIWQTKLPVLLVGEHKTNDVEIELPESLKLVANMRNTKLDYRLEIYWRSLYETGRTKSVLPFEILVDANGDSISVGTVNFEWPAILRIRDEKVSTD